MLDLQTLDSWFVKGFDGLCNYIETRSRNDRPINASYIDTIQKSMDRVEVSIRHEPNIPNEDVDKMLFVGLDDLTNYLMKRCSQMNSRELGPQIKEKLDECHKKLAKALSLLREKVDVR